MEHLLVGRDEVLKINYRLDAALAIPAHPPPYTVAESSANRLKQQRTHKT